MTKLDYSKCKWQIQDVPLDKDIAVFYPELAQVFLEHTKRLIALEINMNIFMRFVVLVYHINSPLVILYDDILVRKRKALILLEQDSTDNILLRPLSEEIGYAVIQFLKFENNIKYKKKVMYEEALSKYQLDLINAIGTDRKSLPDAIETLENLINKTEKDLYRGDDELKDYSESFEIVEARKIFPEEQQ